MLKAVRKGFLDGCPNINVKLILKYLNASPATAKGHMKRPRHGIKSTTPRETATRPNPHIPHVTAQMKPADSISDNSEQTSVIASEQSSSEYNTQRPLLIVDDSGKTIANVFVFGAFADKTMALCIMTSRGHSHSCDWTGAYVFSYFTNTNRIVSWPHQSRG
jgi:hypothetical protein